MTTQPHITEDGFWRDAKGNLVAPDNVRESDKLADDLVRELFAKAETLSADLADFKQQALDDIRAHLEIVAEKYGVKLRGKKGNRQICSYDGSIKFTISIQERVRLGEELVVAEELINQCMAEWMHTAHPSLRSVVEKAFQADSEGKISVYRVYELLRLDVKDDRWRKAMDAVRDSIRVIGSKEYVRVYTRDEDGEYQPVSLNIANS